MAKIIESVQRGDTQDFIIERGLLRRGSQICIPQDPKLKEQIMMEAYCVLYTANPGSIKMYHDL